MPKQRSFHPRPEWPKSVNPLKNPPTPLYPEAPLEQELNLRTFLKAQSRQLESSPNRERREPGMEPHPKARERREPGSDLSVALRESVDLDRSAG